MAVPLTRERSEPQVAEVAAGGLTPKPRRGPVRAAIVALRPQEWIKNLLVFAGLLFSAKFKDCDAVVDATVTFAAFCMISSAGYLFNDLHDVAERPPASEEALPPDRGGELPIPTAIAMAIVLAVVALVGSTLLEGLEVGGLVAGLRGGHDALLLVLKHEVILDVMTIAWLFILRVVAGAVAVDAHASEFLLLCTGMLALFLGFTKRRQEATSELHSGTKTRPVLEHYSLPFLDQMVAMVTAAAVISYAIYAVNSPLIGSKMLATLPPVLYGIFRYLYLIYDRKDTRSTAAILLEDYGMIGAAVIWVASVLILLLIYH